MRKLIGVMLLTSLVGCTSEDPAVALVDDAAADSLAADTQAADTTVADTGTPDDTATTDTATADTKVTDSAMTDSAATDSATTDSATTDSATTDSATTDSAVADAADSMTDTSSDAAATCGNAPYINLNIGGTPTPAGNTADVNIRANICPSLVWTVPPSPPASTKVVQMPKSTPFWLIATQTGSIPALSGEYNVSVNGFTAPAGHYLFTTAIATVADAAWNPATKALVFFNIVPAAGSTGQCAVNSGVTVSVTGHTSDQVIKYNNGTTSTTNDGNGWITLVTTGTELAPEFITVTATKGTCQFLFDSTSALFGTGRTPIAKGHTTAWTRPISN